MRSAHPSETPQLTLARNVTEASFGAVATNLAEAATKLNIPVYKYLFDTPTDALGGILGSCHSLDLPYLFRNPSRTGFTGNSQDKDVISDDMASAFLDFVEGEEPRTPDGRTWPRYSPARPKHTQIGSTQKFKDSPSLESFIERFSAQI